MENGVLITWNVSEKGKAGFRNSWVLKSMNTHHSGRLIIWKTCIRKVAFFNTQCIQKWAAFRIWICLYTNMHTHTVVMRILSKIPIAILKDKHSGRNLVYKSHESSKGLSNMQALPEIQLNVGISCGRFPDSSESGNQNAPNLLGMNMNEHLLIFLLVW